MKNNKTDPGVLTTLLLTGVGALAFSNTMPFLLPVGLLSIASSVGFFAFDVVENLKDDFWEQIGIVNKVGKVPVLVRKIKDENTQYVYHLPVGLSFNQIVAKQAEIENAMKKKVRIELAENYNVIITEQNKKYEKTYKLDVKENSLKRMLFSLGRDINGKAITLDLSGNEMHTGVFGSTGSGKSVCLNVLMTQFVLKNIQTRVIDLKGGVEFSLYRNYKNMAYFAINEDEAVIVLEKTVELMNKRYAMLLEKGCKSYKDFKGMDPVVLLVDEYNALIDNKEAKKLLFELLSRARAANIICIISTQRPSHEVLPGTLKCNLKNFITFKVENEVDSEIVLSQKGNYAAFKELENAGEGLLKTCGKITAFKSYYLSDKEIKEAIQGKLTKKKAIESVEPVKQKTTIKKDDLKKIESLI